MYEGQSGLELTPEQFELEVKKLIQATSGKLTNFSAQHREPVKGLDGEYEIDVTARFEAFGASFLVLVECKRYTASVKREVVQALSDKVRSTGAQKGMIFTTSGFQKGAIEYATAHGIALVQLVDGKTTYRTRSMFESPEPPAFANVPTVAGWLLGTAENGNITLTQVSVTLPDHLNAFLLGR